MMIGEALVKRRVYAIEKHCIGCRLCEIHCITVHSKYRGDILKTYKKQQIRSVSGITVEENIPVSFGLQCRHCDEPVCVKSCITGAMYKDDTTGAVLNDRDRCIGCWTCILVCPYGVIKRDEADGKVASKCDLCTGTGDIPACVKNCPNRALVFE